MKVYIVERIIDGPSDRAERAALEQWPGAEITHGTRAVGLGKWDSAADWKAEWPTFARRLARDLGVIVCSRRTLGLGGTVEVEDGFALGLGVWTVHGRKLYEVTHLWYVEDACRRRCIGKGHRQRMHADPNRVAETRHGSSSLESDGRFPESTYAPRVTT